MENRTNTSEDGVIQIRRNVRLAAVIGVLALVVAALFVLRGGVVGLVVAVVLLVIAVVQLWSAWDGRLPLMLVDEQGVRMRLGETWCGLPWSKIHEVEHTPRPTGLRRLWHDGRVAILPVDEEAEVDTLHGVSRRWARTSQRLYGVPFSVPLGLSTRVVGDDGDLTAALARLAGPSTGVVVIDESLEPEDDTGPIDVVRNDAGTRPQHADEAPESSSDATAVHPIVPESTSDHANPPWAAAAAPDAPVAGAPEPVVEPAVAPMRAITQPVRIDVSYDAPISPLSPEETGRIPRIRDVDPYDSGIMPAVDPVIGPQLAAARERIGLGIDPLAERTRIRPHVIEAMEVDDFGPCGGDFYARGHLRTLARVLGMDPGPLLAEYDKRYADAPVDPRAVFQAELAANGSARALRRVNGGPNWSVLVAAVMAIVLIWSIARLVTASAETPSSNPAISLRSADAGGTGNPYGKPAVPVRVTLSASGGGAHVVVRDASGTVVYDGDLAFGESKTLRISPPLRVQTSDGSLRVSVDGHPAATVGRVGHSAERTFAG